jgi:hypothetical protein
MWKRGYHWPPLTDWEKWFAWYPVKVNGEWQWLRVVYRKKWANPLNDPALRTVYGTIFDVLKD